MCSLVSSAQAGDLWYQDRNVLRCVPFAPWMQSKTQYLHISYVCSAQFPRENGVYCTQRDFDIFMAVRQGGNASQEFIREAVDRTNIRHQVGGSA